MDDVKEQPLFGGGSTPAEILARPAKKAVKKELQAARKAVKSMLPKLAKKRFKKQGPKPIGKPKPAKKAVKKAAKLPKLRNTTKFKAVKKTAKPAGAGVRTHRVDLRLTGSEKAKLQAKAKATRRTVTSIMLELIEKMR